MSNMRSSTIVICVLLAACGRAQAGETEPAPDVISVPPTTTVASTTTTPAPTTTLAPTTTTSAPQEVGRTVSGLDDHQTLVAKTPAEVEVFAAPGDLEPSRTLEPTTILGTATVLVVVEGPESGWARVMLPGRPNGSEGWIETAGMTLYVVESHIEVDLSDRQLSYYEDGEEVLTTTVAIGSSNNPTPTGTFFVTDNVTLKNPDGPWGPHALGLSGRSDTVMEYNGGDGIIGIHGTNKPQSIGSDASLGCVRAPNDVITRLHETIRIGTPVTIEA